MGGLEQMKENARLAVGCSNSGHGRWDWKEREE